MKQPEDVHLSREAGAAVVARLAANPLSAEDRPVWGKVLTFYCWRLFARREAKLSLKRVTAVGLGEKPQTREPPTSGGTASGGRGSGTGVKTGASPDEQTTAAAESPAGNPRPAGQGRPGAEGSRAAQTVDCRHDELAVGERCPACGRGRVSR